jgi:hypothetical protein
VGLVATPALGNSPGKLQEEELSVGLWGLWPVDLVALCWAVYSAKTRNQNPKPTSIKVIHLKAATNSNTPRLHTAEISTHKLSTLRRNFQAVGVKPIISATSRLGMGVEPASKSALRFNPVTEAATNKPMNGSTGSQVVKSTLRLGEKAKLPVAVVTMRLKPTRNTAIVMTLDARSMASTIRSILTAMMRTIGHSSINLREASEVDMANLLVSAMKNVERNSVVVSAMRSRLDRSTGAVVASEADTANPLDKNTVAMKLVGVSVDASKRSIEKKLPKRERRSARRSTERRDVRRAVVGGSLDSKHQETPRL